MTQMVTRCPKCATAFRVTATQLESAKGAVRCGSCLHIFKAKDYLVKSAADKDAEKAKAEAAKVSVTKLETPTAESPTPQIELITTEQIVASVAIAEVQITEATNIIAEPSSVVKKPTLALVPETEKVVVVSKPVIDKAKVLADEDDVLISDDMDNNNEKASTYEFDGFMDLDLNPKQTVSLFEREIRYEPPIEDSNEESEDESWAEELLDDDGEPLQQLRKPVAPPTPVVPVIVESDPEPTDKYTSDEISANTNDKYSGPVFSLVSENSQEDDADEAKHRAEENANNTEHANEAREEPFFSEAFLNATRGPETAPAESTQFAAALFEKQPEIESDDSEKSSNKRPVKSSKIRAFDTSRASLLMNIMPAPVEFTARRMRRWYQKKIWPTLAIIMCALFFFQLAYFKFDYFSRVEPYRTAYLFICPVVGCEVPSLVDTSQILATNLIVRNHPDIASALMVDAILINNAPFEQPFPDLILSFSKLDETPVATRRFTPKEYLGGELAGMKYIPQRQPVHITLEISDPGPDAVNYTLATH